MRCLIAFVALLAVCYAATIEGTYVCFVFYLRYKFCAAFFLDKKTRVFESNIKDALNCLKTNLNSGIPELGLPSFDPLHIETATANFDHLNLPTLK